MRWSFILWGALLWVLSSPTALAHNNDRLEVWVFFYTDGHYQIDLSTTRPTYSAKVGEAPHRAVIPSPAQVDIYFDELPQPPHFVPVEAAPDAHPRAVARIEGHYKPGAEFRWANDPALGKTSLSLRWPESGEVIGMWLEPGEPSEPVKIGESEPDPGWKLGLRYVQQGFSHVIPDGFDHLLFIVALGLPWLSIRRRVVEVTAFTAAHSVTLGLVGLGYIPAAPWWIEVGIAASIGVLALENILSESVSSRRWVWAFGFGLLHGLGFAGAVQALGLPQGRELLALAAFNVGIELAQLTIIAGIVMLAWPWRDDQSAYWRRWVRPVSGLIVCVAVFWMVQRTFGSA